MTEQPTTEELQMLKSKKMNLTLDEYYEQHVRSEQTDLVEERSKQRVYSLFDANIMELTLDEYYEQFVLPKQKEQQLPEEAAKDETGRDQKNIHFRRTHYFGPSYLEQRQPKQPGPVTVQKREKQN